MSGSVSPLPWTGSKGCIYTTIDAFMPPHKTYVEACMGSAEVFLRKRPSEREIINDYNGDLVKFFRVLQRSEKLAYLIGRLYLSFNSEQLFKANKAMLADVPNILDDLTETSVIIENADWSDIEKAVLIDNKMTKTDLKKATGTSSHTITKLGHDEPVSLDFLVRVCQVFHCDIGDIDCRFSSLRPRGRSGCFLVIFIRVHLLPLRNYSCGKKSTGYGSTEPAPYYYNANVFLLSAIYHSECMYRRQKNKKPEGFLLFCVMAHSFKHLDGCGFLARSEADPTVEQFLHIRCQFHHIRVGEELRHSDAESSAYRLKGRNGRNRVSSENVTDRGLCQTALF